MKNFRIFIVSFFLILFVCLKFDLVYSQNYLSETGWAGEYSDLFAEFESIKEDVSQELEGMMPGYRKLTEEKAQIKDKYLELFKKFEALKEDRRNLLAQVRSLLPAKNKIKALQDSLDKIRINLEAMEREKEDAINYNVALKDENAELKKILAQRVEGLKAENQRSKLTSDRMIRGFKAEVEKLKSSQAELTKERNRFRSAYKDLSSGATIKELERQVRRIKKEKGDLVGLLKRRDDEYEQIQAARDQSNEKIEELSMYLREGDKKYANAKEKNRLLEEEARILPQKFTEIVRQNRILVKETARMHYNLGVFYTKNREYERALEEFKKTADMMPDDAYVHFNLGYIYSEHIVDRRKAINHFRFFLRLVKGNDKDSDWVKKYLLTWETYEGQRAFH